MLLKATHKRKSQYDFNKLIFKVEISPCYVNMLRYKHKVYVLPLDTSMSYHDDTPKVLVLGWIFACPTAYE